MKKAVIAGMLGNGLEWYDYALYGHMSLILADLFFPGSDPSIRLINTYLTFAAGFIARPLGAILFGRLGDKYGRKRALVLSMILMAIPTGCIGLLPTYAQIGIMAPILLLIIRILQGFSLGGAYSGSISYVVEHAAPDKRSLTGSVIKYSLVIGFLLGSFVSTVTASVLSPEDFHSWGWRIPFILGVGIGLVGFYIRQHGEESPVYEKAKKEGTLSATPVRDALLGHPGAMLRAFMIYIFVTIPFYALAIYMIAYNKKQLGLSEEQSLLINTCAMASMMLLLYPAARIADRIGRKPVLLGAIVAMLCTLYPAFLAMQTGAFASILIAQCVLTAILGWYLAPIPAILVELFPTSVRYTGMSLAYNCCAIIGGFTPSAAAWLMRETHSNLAIMWLMVISGILSFAAIVTYRDRWREPLA
jgi:MHS family proline/betaine transporter-like MFS transporter